MKKTISNNSIRKYVSAVLALLCCTALSACGQTDTAQTNAVPAETQETVEETTEKPAETPDVPLEAELEFENAYTAQEGQAYLAVANSDWWVQYWGKNEGDGYALSYDAGIADIQGDGYYVVSVNADTKGFRYAMTNDANQDYPIKGLAMLSIVIPNGEKLYPNAVITVSSVKVDGVELEFDAKNVTLADNDDTVASLYSPEFTTPPAESRTEDGPLYDEDGDAMDILKSYSGKIFEQEGFDAAFAEWKKIEVGFSISGTGSSFTPEFAEENDNADAEDN